MRLVLVVPGGVDRTGEVKVIPALLALIERLSRRHDVQVIALRQEERPDRWPLAGAYIHNIGVPRTRLRALHRVYALHRARPVDVIHAFFSGSAGLVAALAGKTLGIPSLVHVAGGELVALADIAYGGAQSWRGRDWCCALLRRSPPPARRSSNPWTGCTLQLSEWRWVWI